MTYSAAVRDMARKLKDAKARYWELEAAAVVAIADAVSKLKSELGIDGAVQNVAGTLGEDWRVVLACFRTAHPNPRHPNPIAQDRDGGVVRTLDVELGDEAAEESKSLAALLRGAGRVEEAEELEEEPTVPARRFEARDTDRRNGEAETPLEPCRVCGDVMTPRGRTCRRCEASLEEDRMNRELGL